MFKSIPVSFNRAENQLEARAQHLPPTALAILVGFVTWLFSFFLYCIPLWMIVLGEHHQTHRLEDFAKLCANPLTRDLVEPILAYRLTTPSLAWLLGLRGESGILIQYLAIPAMLACIFHSIRHRINLNSALWITLGVSITYTVIWPNVHPGFPDSVTHLAAAILLLTKHPLAIISLTTLGTLNDERFVMAIPFLVLWHSNLVTTQQTFTSAIRLSTSFLVGLVFTFAVRSGIKYGYIGPQFETPQVYADFWSFTQNFTLYFINVFMGWRLLWLIPLCYVISKADKEKKLVKLTFSLGILLVIAAPYFVADVSRSVGFAFPALLFGIWRLSKHQLTLLHVPLKVIILLMICTPCFYIMGDNIQLERPLPLSLLRALTGWDITHLLRS